MLVLAILLLTVQNPDFRTFWSIVDKSYEWLDTIEFCHEAEQLPAPGAPIQAEGKRYSYTGSSRFHRSSGLVFDEIYNEKHYGTWRVVRTLGRTEGFTEGRLMPGRTEGIIGQLVPAGDFCSVTACFDTFFPIWPYPFLHASHSTYAGNFWTLAEQEKIAGHDCQVVWFRGGSFAFKFWFCPALDWNVVQYEDHTGGMLTWRVHSYVFARIRANNTEHWLPTSCFRDRHVRFNESTKKRESTVTANYRIEHRLNHRTLNVNTNLNPDRLRLRFATNAVVVNESHLPKGTPIEPSVSPKYSARLENDWEAAKENERKLANEFTAPAPTASGLYWMGFGVVLLAVGFALLLYRRRRT